MKNSESRDTDPATEKYNDDIAKVSALIEAARPFPNTDPTKCCELTDDAIELAEKHNENSLLCEACLLKVKALITMSKLNEATILSYKTLELSRLTGDNSLTASSLLNLGDIYRLKGDSSKAIEFLNEASKIYENHTDAEGFAKIENLLGGVYLRTSDFDRAVIHYSNAIKIFESLGIEKRIAGILSNIGGVYFFTGDYPKALESNQRALTINEKYGNKQWMLSNLGNIGALYFELSDYERALDYFHKALTLSNEIEFKYGAMNAHGNIGSVYSINNDNEKALEHMNKFLQMALESGDAYSQANGYLNIGVIDMKMLKFSEAHDNLKKSLLTAEPTQSMETIATINYNLGVWHLSAPDEIQTLLEYEPLAKYENVIHYLQTSIRICEELNLQNVLQDCYHKLSDLYEQKGNASEALIYFKKYIEIRDRIKGEESKKQVTRKEMQYDFDKKEALAKAEQEKKDELAMKELQRQKFIRNSFVGGFGAVLTFAGIFFKQRNKIREGKELSDSLLLNILPEEVAEELKVKGHAEAKHFDEVTVMFTDFKGFTQISERLSPVELVAEIDLCFKAFDGIISKHNIEKIKTIGDSYMCAGGLPSVNDTNAVDVIKAALEIQEFMLKHMNERVKANKEIFEIRIGVHTGPVVAGIVGVKKFAYDIWGNTVNIASRMESSGEPGKVNISGPTYEIIKDKFECTHRGKIEAKNKGMIDMYFVKGSL